MSTFPTSFDQIDGTGSDGDIARLNNLVSARYLGELYRAPCWNTAVLQWLWTEIFEALQDGISKEKLVLPSAKDLVSVRDSMCGAAVCLLPVDLFDRQEVASLVALRAGLIAQQDGWPDLASEGAAHVLCADHLLRPLGAGKSEAKRQYRLPHRLYPAPHVEVPADWDAFNSLISDLVRAVCARPIEPVWHEPSYETALPTILHELFKNTHDHARSAADGATLKFSMRGVSCQYYALSSSDSAMRTSASDVLDPASVYVREFLDARRRGDSFGLQSRRIEGFLELSIFDSGPGLVGKILKRDPSDISPSAQLEIVRECMKKGFSSTDNELRGYGLSKVLSRLRRSRGFIRIRTNGVSGYRSFARFVGLGHGPNAERPDVRLLDWKTLYAPKQSAYRQLRGTVITVMIPMGEANEKTTRS